VAQTAYDNLAAGIEATSDTTLTWPGVVTNEDTWADSGSGSSGEFAYTTPNGLHYVKLDLGTTHTVDKLKIWHYATDGRRYHHVKVQVSSNGTSWTTIFDSDVSGEYQVSRAG
jgi:NedA-like, galactose-binding domain